MPGRPKTKARREAEIRRGKRFDAFARAEILKRAEEVGAAQAAREAGVAPATLRTWRKRQADAPEPAPVPTPEQETGSRAERLRAAADKARAASSRALDQADSLLARSLASEARNASVVSGVHAERAAELESAARAEEAHEVEMTQARGRLVLDAIERGFVDLGLPQPTEFVRALLGGWPAPVDPEVVARAKDDVRRAIRSEVRTELLAELEEARAARRALPPGEDDAEDDEEPIDAEAVEEDPDPLSEAAQAAKLEEFLAENPGNPEAAERRLSLWVSQMEIRRDTEARLRADEEIGEPSELELDAYIGQYVDRDLALREWRRDRRPQGGVSLIAGRSASRVAPLREQPRVGGMA